MIIYRCIYFLIWSQYQYNILMKKRDLSRLDQLNIIVFPMVYGQGSQDNEIAKELFEMMVKYA
jgi:hypothetical protein